MPRSLHPAALLFLTLLASAAGAAERPPDAAPETVAVDAHAPGTPLPHFWEQIFGSGHANLALRAGWLDDLAAVKSVTGLQYVRFHGILDDENGVYTEDEHGNPQYNFTYVDQIYDGMLARGVRPYVEISFMPKLLAAYPAQHVFWYHPTVAPPRDYARWDALIRAFAQNLVDRYGVDEVSQWYFEVWNEPNIDFWAGNPKQPTYFTLYQHTARALKAVSPRLRVGGPATAAEEWVPDFLGYMHDHDVPVDFLSTHGYADEQYEHTFTAKTLPPMDDRLCGAMKIVKQQIAASPMPKIPWVVSEWNVIGIDAARDTTFVGPAVANTIRECDGLATMMSFWTFDDIFEEDGVKREPFDGGFGLIAPFGIRKPALNAFAMLHTLGTERLASPSRNALVTRRPDGTLVIAVWNMADPAGAHQPGDAAAEKTMTVAFDHVPAGAAVRVARLDATHGNTLAAYRQMGSPRYPTPSQIRELNRASDPGPPERTHLRGGRIDVRLPVNALVVMEVRP
jgi:xylan 1,4-beta-xylosidase